MKERIVIIGGGVIMRHYAAGLRQSGAVEAVALCDVNENCLARSEYSNLPFYTDYQKAIKECKPDGVIVSTPVSLHAEIAKTCLRLGLHVYVEKPLCTDMQTLQDLYATAEKTGKKLTALFHWQYADEVLFLKEYLKGKQIKKISICIGDDYACEPLFQIRKDRRGLGGAWFDSGINALSYVQELLPLDGAKLDVNEQRVDESCGLPYYASRRFLVGDVEVQITVDWTVASREKTSVIETEEGRLFVDHTAQQVEKEGKIIYQSVVADRLSSHYRNMFALPMEKGADKESKLLHEILLQA